MKSIMISIKPEWVEKVLNGEKTIEIRKTKPKCELPCKVYIYCTKPTKWYAFSSWGCTSDELLWKIKDKIKMCNGLDVWDEDVKKLNGKVVAEFTLKNIVKFDIESLVFLDKEKELMQKSCVGGMSLRKYLGNKTGYSWGIDDLKIYDEPKELSEFTYNVPDYSNGVVMYSLKKEPLKRPPQSFYYVEELGK